jgi:hypothetical protein
MTVVLSVVVLVLLPRINAMMMISNMIPPTTHIHGCVYQVVVVVVVVFVVLELELVLSCANTTAWIIDSVSTAAKLISRFIPVFFGER